MTPNRIELIIARAVAHGLTAAGVAELERDLALADVAATSNLTSWQTGAVRLNGPWPTEASPGTGDRMRRDAEPYSVIS